jgi:hypothetical protein
MIDLRHPLAVLATRMPWAAIEARLAPLFERCSRDGRLSEAVDLFGVSSQELAGGVSAAGRPRLPVRLMVGLLYLKHTYNESDESVCERWAQDVYFQILCKGSAKVSSREGFVAVGIEGRRRSICKVLLILRDRRIDQRRTDGFRERTSSVLSRSCAYI